ncbi:hypothetical protein CHF27_012025 [Romboutsia maritimum]|uniref:Uncharacterized protein n=1 Tax=Romboutsia maritimum TaxID=2020948 RepID=A0A371IQC9_9FIRM|nr:hypothetical protein [Romboutsia maritimum]RDY22697.1 hypothetical protein CHF27_012025 [Romboutsia maritimum]
MGLVIGIIVVLIGLVLLGGLIGAIKESGELGQLFLFAIFMIIICSIFGGFIPFSELIIKISGFVIVALIIYFGYNMIFN